MSKIKTQFKRLRRLASYNNKNHTLIMKISDYLENYCKLKISCIGKVKFD